MVTGILIFGACWIGGCAGIMMYCAAHPNIF